MAAGEPAVDEPVVMEKEPVAKGCVVGLLFCLLLISTEVGQSGFFSRKSPVPVQGPPGLN